ncbi:MAG: hypothetical protein HGA44_11305 [Cellulomonadaceae bacterium]|nr:hypothetical protein [Cellulomonadaceae bacterium]
MTADHQQPGSAAARRGAPARVLAVTAAQPAADLAHQILTARHCSHRRTGVTGARVYEFGSRLGDVFLGGAGARLLLGGPLQRLTVHGWLVVDPVAGVSPTLTVAGAQFDPASGAWVTSVIDAVVAELARRGLLVDAGEPVSSLELTDSPAFPQRFRSRRGD